MVNTAKESSESREPENVRDTVVHQIEGFRPTGYLISRLSLSLLSNKFLSAFFPASCTFASDQKRASGATTKSDENIVTQEIARIWSAKKSLTRLHYVINFIQSSGRVVLCTNSNWKWGLEGVRESEREREKKSFYVSRFVSHQAFWICDFASCFFLFSSPIIHCSRRLPLDEFDISKSSSLPVSIGALLSFSFARFIIIWIMEMCLSFMHAGASKNQLKQMANDVVFTL